ncbi:hypothetical protein AWW66_23980 [Micromonospora rosaria]|uniref:Uncharacterized protein n=1 Tax=Micromonospora rosaria TaxID=47874 RepID=A0A136PM95_9ACTN|nr:hypothetical protein [Micromonospora rosaria]KXK59482.1 hypothetical protein AWW66_23980 [Micromonospora rosaria]
MTDSTASFVPSYYLYYDSPVKVVGTPDGGARLWRLSADDGAWKERNDLFVDVVLAVGGDVFTIDVSRFVQEVEWYRARYLSGEGPIFALYETVDAIVAVAEGERRRLTPAEQAMVHGIRRKTFVMFEEELQRAGHPGADPTLARQPGDAQSGA